MCVDYNTLDGKKRAIRHAITLKKRLERLQKESRDANSKIFALVKQYNGIACNDILIEYRKSVDAKDVLDVEAFAQANPSLYHALLCAYSKKSGARTDSIAFVKNKNV